MHFKVISFLRRIFEPVKENYRRCRNNTNLREQYKQPDTVYENKSVRLGCLGHLLKKADRYMMKILFVKNPCDKRMQRRPRKRQHDDVYNGGRKLLWGRSELRLSERLKSCTDCNCEQV